MNTINYGDVFNSYTLNIFTDASIKMYPELNNFTVSVPGAVAVITNDKGDSQIIDSLMYTIPFSTNNDGEISAIRLGVFLALRNRHLGFKKINLFSDSNICIQGLNDYIYKWFAKRKGDVLISSSNKPAFNQEIFKAIINDIVNNQLYIELYHQKGHVGETCTVNYAMEDFKRTNGLVPSRDLMNVLSMYNKHVDIMTKIALQSYNSNLHYYLNSMQTGFKINQLNQTKMDQYRSYTRKE